MDGLCEACTHGAKGEAGHDALAFYVGGPYPGHHIFKCGNCGERWIRHYGTIERYGWVRYSQQFPMRVPAPVRARGVEPALQPVVAAKADERR